MDSLFERMTSPNTMLDAEDELIALGDGALDRLAALFDGSSRNESGTPYRALGLPLACALEIVIRLGSKAKPLEAFVAAELPANATAARALGALRELTSTSVEALAMELESPLSAGDEAAIALVRCHQDQSQIVDSVCTRSDRAKRRLEFARRTVARFPNAS